MIDPLDSFQPLIGLGEHYRLTQMRTELYNCNCEKQILLARIETLEKEIEDLHGELAAAEEELTLYDQKDKFDHTTPDDPEI